MRNDRNSFCISLQRGYLNNVFFYKKQKSFSAKDFCYFYNVNPKSFFGLILSRYYHYYTKDSFYPFDLYRKYYKREYVSYEAFLIEHLLFPGDLIKRYGTRSVACKYLYLDSDSTIANFENEDEYPFGNPYKLILRYFNRTDSNED